MISRSAKPPRLKELSKLAEQEGAAIVKDLEQRFGKPEPFVPK